MNDVYPYTTFRLLSAIVRAMMVTSHCPALFDMLKGIFLKVLVHWDNLTPRLQSCAQVTVRFCGTVKAHLRVKLVASLLRELWMAWGITNDYYLGDENLLTLIPDLGSVNVYYTPDITLVCNIKRKCLGVVVKSVTGDDDNDERMNMLTYAVIESAIQVDPTDMPTTFLDRDNSKSTLKLEYVKVNGIPSDEDDYDVQQYLPVHTLTSLSPTEYCFAVWNKSQRQLKYETSTCPLGT